MDPAGLAQMVDIPALTGDPRTDRALVALARLLAVIADETPVEEDEADAPTMEREEVIAAGLPPHYSGHVDELSEHVAARTDACNPSARATGANAVAMVSTTTGAVKRTQDPESLHLAQTYGRNGTMATRSGGRRTHGAMRRGGVRGG